MRQQGKSRLTRGVPRFPPSTVSRDAWRHLSLKKLDYGTKRLVVSGNDGAEDIARDAGETFRFFLSTADRSGNPVRKTAERQSLQDDMPWACQCGVEKTLAAEQRVAKSADELNVIRDRFGKRDDAAGVDAKLFAGPEVEFEHVAAGVQKEQPLAADFLQDETLATEKTGTEAFCERNREIDIADRRQIRVSLGKNRVAIELNGKDFSGDRIRERELALCGVAAEHAHEHRLAREKLAHEALHQPALHPCLKIDARSHEEHRPGLGVNLLTLPQIDLQRLHDIAYDLVFHAPHCICADGPSQRAASPLSRFVQNDIATTPARRSRSRQRRYREGRETSARTR